MKRYHTHLDLFSGKSVSFLKGLDDDVWVWVMGEHSLDKPYDQICDEILAESAALQAQREAQHIRAKKEAELEKRFSGVYLDSEQTVTEQKNITEQRRAEEELKTREAEERRRAEEELRRLELERKQQIYVSLKEVQKKKQTCEDEDNDWKQTLKKSKAADMRRRSLAKQTVEDHRRRSVKALERGRVAAVTKAFGRGNPNPTQTPTPPPKPKPRNNPTQLKPGIRRSLSASGREHIIRWFQEEQLPLKAGFQQDQSRIAPWFHGIISRDEAEALLNEGQSGHFLVRVSERVFGYVLSYRSSEGIKHLLIDASENCYMLLGDQMKFTSLDELVEYHQVEPLPPSGDEYLLHACGQRVGAVDYTDLFT
ncbi:SH2 domain-containing protein 4A [Triplophysa tibetana]|uniref:SH2 domain-containing protein 4A n=1 Tax=Triplophysa tibetana TaxID=1572043 RepID=A0A5A9N0P1_9TELE|nr:SH2 domain-containing protein 4A [Triplophysa tibetana]